MDREKEFAFLHEIEQSHLLQDFALWPNYLQKNFREEVIHWNKELFLWQQTFLKKDLVTIQKWNTPLPFILEKQPILSSLGKAILTKRGAGVIILAAGQGSRLGFPGPKGCLPLPMLQNRSIFAILLHRCRVVCEEMQTTLPIAIITSSSNHEATRAFLHHHQFFHLDPKSIVLIKQESFPFLDRERNWFLESPGRISAGSNGNGSAFLAAKKILQQWKKEGIDWIQVLPIDNLLGRPFDPCIFGCHIFHKSDLVILTIKKRSVMEQLGVLGEKEGKIGVIEYFEEKKDRDLIFAYLGIFSCHIDVALQASNATFSWHFVNKEEKKLVRNAEGWRQVIVPAWKLERFLFDIFSHAKNFRLILEKREEAFAPVKSLLGEYSLEKAQKSFLAFETKILESYTPN